MTKYTITVRAFDGATLQVKYIPGTDIAAIREGLIRAIHNGVEFHYTSGNFTVIYPAAILQNGMVTIELVK